MPSPEEQAQNAQIQKLVDEGMEPSEAVIKVCGVLPDDEALTMDLKAMRTSIVNIAAEVRKLMEHAVFSGEQKFLGSHQEMKANIMLAYRHLEDARMRLGKVQQYNEDGISCYDKGEQPKC